MISCGEDPAPAPNTDDRDEVRKDAGKSGGKQTTGDNTSRRDAGTKKDAGKVADTETENDGVQLSPDPRF
ncbi:MAG: hypothetical protein RLZZ450_4972 [Pseudomonadota bacterium]